MDKVYIGKVEALEILLTTFAGYSTRLPRKGTEFVNVPSIASGLDITTLGKDESGFYVKVQSNVNKAEGKV